MLIVSSFLSLSVPINPVGGDPTVVKVDPSLIEYYEDATGQEFTVAIKIVDVTNLYGFDMKFRWNTTFLEYVNHSVRVPKDTYSDGVLWNPLIFELDEVNETAGTCWIAYSSRWPAPSFNGTGTVFTITLKVKYHPIQPAPTANIALELYSTELSNNAGEPIPHTRQHGTVILYALTPGDVAVLSVTPSHTEAYPTWKPLLNVTVVVKNEGTQPETFDVHFYANCTGKTPIREDIAGVNLGSGESRALIFGWNVTGIDYGNYTLSAIADVVPGETHTQDNNMTNGVVNVKFPGDASGDNFVNALDFGILGFYWFNVRGFDPRPDFNGDNFINAIDFGILGKYWFKGP